MTGEPNIRNYKHSDVTVGKSPQIKVVRLPFTNTATVETSTNFYLPGPCLVYDVAIQVTTAVAASTIDVGTLSTGTNGDADGFLDGTACTASGFVAQAGSDANTLGVFLEGAEQSGSNTRLMKGLVSTDERLVTYTTNDKAIAGYIYITYVDLGDMKNY